MVFAGSFVLKNISDTEPSLPLLSRFCLLSSVYAFLKYTQCSSLQGVSILINSHIEKTIKASDSGYMLC